jgi:hypothetical protein
MPSRIASPNTLQQLSGVCSSHTSGYKAIYMIRKGQARQSAPAGMAVLLQLYSGFARGEQLNCRSSAGLEGYCITSS